MSVKRGPTSIFILGAGVMQLPAIRAAKAMGWRVIVADGSRTAEGVPLADRFEHVDLKDLAAMTEAVRACQRDGGVDGVFTAGTDFSATVAWVAGRCGLPGLPYETARNATDKARMRRVFREHNVPQPDFQETAQGDDPQLILKKLKFPLVVKPVDNMGARGVRRIDSREELEESLAAAFALSRTGRAIVESYVAGPEFSLDALVHEGRPTLCGLAERHIFFEPFFVEMGHTMPAALDERTRDGVVSVFYRGIRALGIDNGAAKGDIKLSADGPVVGEIAARLSGGYMSGWTYPFASGVEVTRSALRIAVGLPPEDLSPRESSVSAERAFISMPGMVERIDGIEQARALPGVKEVFLRAQAGGAVEFPKNNIQKCGNVITKAASREEAEEQARSALAEIFIRLRAGRPESNDFLKGDTLPHISAFRPELEENRRAFEAMPEWTGDPGRSRSAAPLVLALPRHSAETARDWHGLTLLRLAEVVRRQSNVRFVERTQGTDFTLGKLFWRALFRAGAQGAVYLLDTLAQDGPAALGELR